MATKTLGTNANNSLTAVKLIRGWNSGLSAADVAAINIAIVGDGKTNPGSYGGQFTESGLLFLPRDRGVIQVFNGDWVAVDSTGWPIVVSANAVTNGPWTHS